LLLFNNKITFFFRHSQIKVEVSLVFDMLSADKQIGRSTVCGFE